MIKYSTNHSWIQIEEENIIKVGITKYIINMLGEIVHVDLPKISSQFTSGNEILALEATKSVSDIEAPLGGEIIAINHEVIENPSLVTEDPESAGWLYKMKIHSIKELDLLLTQEKYLEYCK